MSLPPEEPLPQVKLRIPARVALHLLEGTEAAYRPEADPEIAAVLDAIRGATARKDGSCTISISDPGQLDTLRVYVEAMETGAADNTHEPDGVADLNAARAVLRALNTAATGT